ncbi:MAG: type II secretion system protein [SAR324 cluster bacterium]|uniref:Type II secretion system protein n=1 Tax=SAR324 cluster bacterium TaxID=2024889 RepID=A0A7X9IL87_9DELT|nr:type II secretion system protein [SAR324 cluster bacterium]
MVSEAGETLVSLLVSISLISIVFAATLSSFMQATRHGFEHQIRIQAIEEANAILDLMAFDLRMLGSGMPLGQGGFAICDLALGDVTLPVLTDATSKNISFRLNERGGTTVVTSDFDPASQTNVSVSSAEGFKVGDNLYLNNVSTGSIGGLSGIIAAIAGNVLSLSGGAVYTTGTTFRAGSLGAGVTLLTYDSPITRSIYTGITRDHGNGPIMLAPNSSVNLTFIDTDGMDMVLPLTSASIATNLAGVRIDVIVDGAHTLRDGSIFTARATHQVAFRNLNISR